ncbi:MAG: hypothetical protein KGP35_06815 [Bacteroidetes bacterium]|nr:hypothetical protein [Bacteroidota bacterium]
MNLSATISPIVDVTSGPRQIHDGSRFSKYFPLPDERDRIIIKDGEVDDTVELMEKVVHKYLVDTAKIAPLLKKNTLKETCRSIWEFIYQYIQYKLDKKGLEQLRRPARTWADRKSGVDCDCMSIFTSSILTNLKIPHKFRITRYTADHWQHVYVIVTTNNGEHICIDGVVSAFNYEKPFTDKFDYAMSLNGINVAVLSGLNSDLDLAVMAPGLAGDGFGAVSEKSDLDKLYQHLVATRKSIADNPKMISTIDDPQAFIKMLDYAIQYWYTDKRDEALSILEKNEEQLNIRNGFSGLSADMLDHDEFALNGPGKKGFFKGISTAVSKVGKGLKEVGKAVVRFNPLSIAARGGFLLSLKMNLGKMAAKLKWAYATKEQAAAKGISADYWNKSKEALAKVERLFADKLQGKRDALRNAILKGKAGNLDGYVQEEIQGLGEPVTAATLTAATPIIVAVIKILKDSGLVGKGENLDASSITNEMASDPTASSLLKVVNQDNPADNSTATDPSAAKTAATSTDATTDATTTDTGTSGGGIMEFIKKNPVPAVIGGGLLAFGIYKMVSKPKKQSSLSGYRSKKKNHSKKQHGNIQNQHAGKKHLPVKAMKLL